MTFTQAGLILFTQNYAACVRFYGKVLQLKILHQIDRPGETLTAFDLGGTYLMVETGGTASAVAKPLTASPVKLRFNVPDVAAAAEALRGRGVSVEVFYHSWGVTAEFADPDGNRCALRSDSGFGE